jgi:hypothetical protein
VPTQHLVPRRTVTAQEVDEVAAAAGWTRRRDPDDGDDGPGPPRWRTPDGATVTLAHPASLPVPHLVVDGPEPGEVTARLLRAIPCHSVDELVATLRLATDEDERQGALLGLAATGLDTPRADVADAVTTSVGDPSASVRTAALIAARRLRWPGFRALVAAAAEGDEDPDVRAVAHNQLLLTDWPPD